MGGGAGAEVLPRGALQRLFEPLPRALEGGRALAAIGPRSGRDLLSKLVASRPARAEARRRSRGSSSSTRDRSSAGEGGDVDEELPLCGRATVFGRKAELSDVVVTDGSVSRQPTAALLHQSSGAAPLHASGCEQAARGAAARRVGGRRRELRVRSGLRLWHVCRRSPRAGRGEQAAAGWVCSLVWRVQGDVHLPGGRARAASEGGRGGTQAAARLTVRARGCVRLYDSACGTRVDGGGRDP